MIGDCVFVCYSREDKDFVLKLASNLKDRGVPMWLDQWNISPGDDWPSAIDEALSDCARILVVLSPSSVKSREVESEWRAALDKEKTVVPILYQECRIPYRLKLIQYIDFISRSPDDGKAIEQILKALRSTGSNFTKPPNQSVDAKKRNKVNLKYVSSAIYKKLWSRKFYKVITVVYLLGLWSLFLYTLIYPNNMVSLTSDWLESFIKYFLPFLGSLIAIISYNNKFLNGVYLGLLYPLSLLVFVSLFRYGSVDEIHLLVWFFLVAVLSTIIYWQLLKIVSHSEDYTQTD